MGTLISIMIFLITLHDGLDWINCIWLPIILIVFLIEYNDDGSDTEFYTGY